MVLLPELDWCIGVGPVAQGSGPAGTVRPKRIVLQDQQSSVRTAEMFGVFLQEPSACCKPRSLAYLRGWRCDNLRPL